MRHTASDNMVKSKKKVTRVTMCFRDGCLGVGPIMILIIASSSFFLPDFMPHTISLLLIFIFFITITAYTSRHFHFIHNVCRRFFRATTVN